MKAVLFFITLLCPLIAYAEYCQLIGNVCTEGASTRIVDGMKVTRDCWGYEDKYKCFADDFKDYCTGISKTPGCESIKHKCLEKGKDGYCDKTEFTYKCGNLLQETQGVEYLNTEHSIVDETEDTTLCSQQDIDKKCTLAESTCVDGPSEKLIDGKKVFKDCWKYERKYICSLGSKINECKQFEKKCAFVKERCLSKKGEGYQCLHKEKTYNCLKLNEKTPKTMECNGLKYCLWGDCNEPKLTPNQNMGKSISYLSILSNAKNDMYQDNCVEGSPSTCQISIFKGENKQCEKHIASGITKNCCLEGKGFLEKMKFMGCSPEEENLAEKASKKLCVEVGTYCSSKFLKKCVTKKKSYCCYKSKISALIQEQGRRQLGIGWGDPETPDCGPLSIEQIQKLDFSKMDFSSLYADIKMTMNANIHKQTTAKNNTANKVKEAQENPSENTSGYISLEKPKTHNTLSSSKYKEAIDRRLQRHYEN